SQNRMLAVRAHWRGITSPRTRRRLNAAHLLSSIWGTPLREHHWNGSRTLAGMQLRCATRSGRALPVMKRQVDPGGRDAGRATASDRAPIGCPFEADRAARDPLPVAT